MTDFDHPILIIFSRDPDDEMVTALRGAMRREGALPDDEAASQRPLAVNTREAWRTSEEAFELTNHECGVLLEAPPALIDRVRAHVQPRNHNEEA